MNAWVNDEQLGSLSGGRVNEVEVGARRDDRGPVAPRCSSDSSTAIRRSVGNPEVRKDDDGGARHEKTDPDARVTHRGRTPSTQRVGGMVAQQYRERRPKDCVAASPYPNMGELGRERGRDGHSDWGQSRDIVD